MSLPCSGRHSQRLCGASPYAKNGPTVCEGVISDITVFLRARSRPTSPALVLVRILRCGFAPAQHDIKAEAERPIGDCIFQIERRNHALPCVLIRYRIEYRVERKQGITREIHLSDKPRQERVAEHRKMDVVRPPCIV